jgi:hypothetical protein
MEGPFTTQIRESRNRLVHAGGSLQFSEVARKDAMRDAPNATTDRPRSRGQTCSAEIARTDHADTFRKDPFT